MYQDQVTSTYPGLDSPAKTLAMETGEVRVEIKRLGEELTKVEHEVNALIEFIIPVLSTNQTQKEPTGRPEEVPCSTKIGQDIRSLRSLAENIRMKLIDTKRCVSI